MIFNELKDSRCLEVLRLGFARAFEFLRNEDLASLACETYEIEGREIYGRL